MLHTNNKEIDEKTASPALLSVPFTTLVIDYYYRLLGGIKQPLPWLSNKLHL